MTPPPRKGPAVRTLALLLAIGMLILAILIASASKIYERKFMGATKSAQPINIKFK